MKQVLATRLFRDGIVSCMWKELAFGETTFILTLEHAV